MVLFAYDLVICEHSRAQVELQLERWRETFESHGLRSVFSSSSTTSLSYFYVGSVYDDICLHVARSYTSSDDSPFSLIYSFTLSNHFLLGLPLFILPVLSFPLHFFLRSDPLLITCPCLLNLLSWTFFAIYPTFVVPLILSFLIRIRIALFCLITDPGDLC